MSVENKIKALEEELAELRKECAAQKKPKMVKIQDRDYSVSETPITVAQYRAFCGETDRDMPEQPEPHRENNPVVNVSWYDAKAYCKWLSQKTGESYRLPTEDEFEHFCGDHTQGEADTAVFSQERIQPVKTKKPNKYGLYDALGLVWEWQENSYD